MGLSSPFITSYNKKEPDWKSSAVNLKVGLTGKA